MILDPANLSNPQVPISFPSDSRFVAARALHPLNAHWTAIRKRRSETINVTRFPDSSAAYGEDEVDHRAIIAADVRRGTRRAILSKPAVGPLLQPEYGQLVTKSQGVFGRRHLPQLCSASAAGAVSSGSPDFSFASILTRSSGSGLRSRACDHWKRASSRRPTLQ